MNIDKIKVMEIRKTKHNIKIVVEGKSEEEVENFKYLREFLNRNKEIVLKTRIEKKRELKKEMVYVFALNA